MTQRLLWHEMYSEKGSEPVEAEEDMDDKDQQIWRNGYKLLKTSESIYGNVDYFVSPSLSVEADLSPTSSAPSIKSYYATTDEELAAVVEGDKRNWRGICISLLVIVFICGIIATAVFLLSPELREIGRKTKKEKILLEEIIHGIFSPRNFNGTWLNDKELLYRDFYGNLVVLNLDSPESEPKLLVGNTTFQVYYVQKYSLSPNRQYLMLVHDMRKIFRHTYLAKHKLYRIKDEELIPLTPDPSDTNADLQYASWGPTGAQLVFVHRNNIYYKQTPEAFHQRIATSPQESVISNGIPDWLYEEEILSSSSAIWWSPDGSRICYASFNDTEVDEMPYPWYGAYDDPTNLYPATVQLRYPKPGRNNPTVTLWVVDVKSLSKNASPVTPPKDIISTDHYFTAVTWADEDNLLVIWMKRVQNYSSISICKVKTGWICETTLEAKSDGKGWVDLYEAPLFGNDSQHYFLRLPSFQSNEKGYFRHIARVSLNDGKTEFITSGNYDTTEILALDSKRNVLYYISTLPQKPGERHLFEANLITNNSKCLTCDMGANCLYNSATFSPGGQSYALECLGPGIPRVELRNAETNALYQMIQSNDLIREKLEKKSLPRIKSFSVPIEGGYNASVKLYLPPSLKEDEITKYPVLIQVYGGPGSQQVSERFVVNWGYYLSTRKNIIYGMIDGRGSGYKGDKLLHELYYKLGTVEVEDQISVTRYLREELSYVDKDKIGIWGWSYGGYVTAMALATDRNKSPVFSCGISVAPVTNWMYYDSAYTERYMGFPTQDDNYINYKKANVMDKAGNMKGKKFLLVHGTADDNVHMQQSMMLIKALTRNGILFHSQVYPDENHALPGVTRHLYRTMEAFLNECFELDTISDDVGLRRRRVTRHGSSS